MPKKKKDFRIMCPVCKKGNLLHTVYNLFHCLKCKNEFAYLSSRFSLTDEPSGVYRFIPYEKRTGKDPHTQAWYKLIKELPDKTVDWILAKGGTK
jgi:hypothetical protein